MHFRFNRDVFLISIVLFFAQIVATAENATDESGNDAGSDEMPLTATPENSTVVLGSNARKSTKSAVTKTSRANSKTQFSTRNMTIDYSEKQMLNFTNENKEEKTNNSQILPQADSKPNGPPFAKKMPDEATKQTKEKKEGEEEGKNNETVLGSEEENDYVVASAPKQDAQLKAPKTLEVPNVSGNIEAEIDDEFIGEESYALHYIFALSFSLAVLYLAFQNRRRIIGYLLEGRPGTNNGGGRARYRRLSQHNVNDDETVRRVDSNI